MHLSFPGNTDQVYVSLQVCFWEIIRQWATIILEKTKTFKSLFGF